MAVVILKGSAYTLKTNVNTKTNDADQFQVSIDQEFIRLTEKQLENGTLLLDIESISKGKAYIYYSAALLCNHFVPQRNAGKHISIQEYSELSVDYLPRADAGGSDIAFLLWEQP